MRTIQRRIPRRVGTVLLATIALLVVLVPSATEGGASASASTSPSASLRAQAGATTELSHPARLASNDQISNVATGILDTRPFLCLDSWVLNSPANPAAWGDRSIDLGGTLYPAATPATDQGVAQVLVIDQKTGGVVSNANATSIYGLEALLNEVQTGEMAIVTASHLGDLFPIDVNFLGRFSSDVGKLGMLAPPSDTNPQWFSGVGWPGLAPGQGWSAYSSSELVSTNTSTTAEHSHCGGAGETVSLAGNLGGALIPDQNGERYSFVTTDSIRFSSQGGTGSITYAGRTSGPDPSTKGAGGFHDLEIDSLTGRVQDNTFSTDTVASVSKFAQFLLEVSKHKEMVIVASYGTPLKSVTVNGTAQLDALRELVNAIQALGGSSTPIVAMALGRNPNKTSGNVNDYSLVGASQIPPAAGVAPFNAVESSPVLGGLERGTVEGQFNKDHTGHFVPALAGGDLTGTAIPDLTSIAMGAPSAFPAPDAAFKWISQKVTAEGTLGTPTTNVRTLYPTLSASAAPTLAASVRHQTYPGATAGFTDEAFIAARATASKELDALGAVKSYLGKVNQALENAASQVDSKVAAVTTEVSNAAGNSGISGTSIGLFVADLIVGLLYVAAAFFPPASALSAPALALIELLNVGTTIGSFTANALQPADPRQVIQTTGGQLSAVLSGELRSAARAVNVVQAVVIGDPAKLAHLDEKVRANGPWSLSSTDLNRIDDAITISTKAFATESLLEKSSVPFQASSWRLTGPKSGLGLLDTSNSKQSYYCDAGYFYFVAFADLPFSRWTLLMSPDDKPPTIQLGLITIPSPQHNSNKDDSDAISAVLGHLFNSKDATPAGAGLGMIPTLSDMVQTSGTQQLACNH